MGDQVRMVSRWHIFHRWAKWSDVIVTKDGAPVQVRTCTLCNRQEVKMS